MATTASFNALRQHFVDLRTRVDNGFTEIRGKFNVIAAADMTSAMSWQECCHGGRVLEPPLARHRV